MLADFGLVEVDLGAGVSVPGFYSSQWVGIGLLYISHPSLRPVQFVWG
jgi:hypothetical protein